MRTLRLTLVCWALLACTARAQDDVAAGLFAEARQLPLVEQSLSLQVASGEAVLRLEQVYVNDGDAVAQADYRAPLPRGASLTRFGFEKDGAMLWAKLERKADAEADHRTAASEGRTTALASQREGVASFSVYPLAAGDRKRIAFELRVPVVHEMGQGRLRLPLEAFAGRQPPETPVWVELHTEGTLLDWGADGLEVQTVVREARHVSLAFSTASPVELFWLEDGPPLSMRAHAVPLDEGLGLAFEATLRDAETWARGYRQVHLLLDASYSMRRRHADLAFVLDRVLSRSAAPVSLWAVAEHVAPLEGDGDPDAWLAALRSGRYGHRAQAEDFARALVELDCGRPDVRCAVVSDGQLEGLDAVALGVPVLLLSTVDELAHAEAHAPPPPGVTHFRAGADSRALLASQVDPLVLPVLEIESLELGGHPLPLLGEPNLRVAEGGSLTLHALPEYAGELRVRARVDGRDVTRVLPLEDLAPDDPRAAALRYGVYRSQLAAWMRTYREAPDDALRERITEVSLREGIPTAFTSLQVDDPELSLYAVKPGDPLLRVAAEPGLVRVVAYYPFGETRELTRVGDDFLDRFLVPRHWAERGYRIRVFKHYADGRVSDASAYYRLDDRGPEALLWLDDDRGQLVVDVGEGLGDVARVEVHAEDGRVHVLTPVDARFRLGLAEAGARFHVFVRDRAGNRTHFDCELRGGVLHVHAPPPAAPARAARLAHPRLEAARGAGLSIDDGVLRVDGLAQPWASDARAASLHSLRRTAQHATHDGSLWFGTAAGDLVRLHDCGPEGCAASPHAPADWRAHPVTGIEELRPGHLLVAVLGRGLFEVRDGEVVRSRLRVGTRRVSGLARDGDDLLIATHTRGLWRITPGASRPLRGRFPHAHVAALVLTGRGLRIDSGFGSYLRRGRDRFESVPAPAVAPAPPLLTASAVFEGRRVVGSFDRGLFHTRGPRSTELVPWDTGLSGSARHVNALLAQQAQLWVGSEGGLFAIDGDGRATRLLDAAVHGLAAHGGQLAVASSAGLHLRDADGQWRRLDGQGLLPTARFTAVAFHADALYAGGLDGLFRLAGPGYTRAHALGAADGFDAAWVTALVSDGRHLFVGTYASGLHALTDDRLAPVRGLEGQWVPPGGLSLTGQGLWVGGLGMPPAVVDSEGGRACAVPALDVASAFAEGSTSVLLTSEGALAIGLAPGPDPTASP